MLGQGKNLAFNLRTVLFKFIDTCFALFTYNRMMEEIGQETPTLLNAALVVLFYIAVYGIFYLLSVGNYFKAVWRRGGEAVL